MITIRDYLEFADYLVEVASNDQDGIALANQIKLDLIIMNVQMPVMDGLEAMRRIRAQAEFEHTPIIVFPAFAMVGDRERCLNAGATDYMSKPVQLKKLAEMIKSLLHLEA